MPTNAQNLHEENPIQMPNLDLTPTYTTQQPNFIPSPNRHLPSFFSPSLQSQLPSTSPQLSSHQFRTPGSPSFTIDTHLHHSPTPTSTPFVPRRSSRPIKPNVCLADYICSIETQPNQSSSTCLYPLQSVLSYSNISESERHYIMNLSSGIEPQSYQEAILSPYWVEAMKDEIEALKLNNTWEIFDTLAGVKPMG